MVPCFRGGGIRRVRWKPLESLLTEVVLDAGRHEVAFGVFRSDFEESKVSKCL